VREVIQPNSLTAPPAN